MLGVGCQPGNWRSGKAVLACPYLMGIGGIPAAGGKKADGGGGTIGRQIFPPGGVYSGNGSAVGATVVVNLAENRVHHMGGGASPLGSVEIAQGKGPGHYGLNL